MKTPAYYVLVIDNGETQEEATFQRSDSARAAFLKACKADAFSAEVDAYDADGNHLRRVFAYGDYVR